MHIESNETADSASMINLPSGNKLLLSGAVHVITVFGISNKQNSVVHVLFSAFICSIY